MNTTKLIKMMIVIGAVVIAGRALAADSGSGTIGVTASIAPECAVGNTTELYFGAMTMLSANGARTTAARTSIGGTFDTICTNGTSTPKLRFTSSNAGGSNFRLVGADGSTYIHYTLAESSSGTEINPGSDAAFAGLIADGSTKSLRVVGTVSADAKHGKAAQTYSDTITITSSYTP
jgi:spore coat protein U-like protein